MVDMEGIHTITSAALESKQSKELDHLEHELEDELKYDKQSSKTTVGRCRMRLKLHSKSILGGVVFLNILDCLVVIGEQLLEMMSRNDRLDKLSRVEKVSADIRSMCLVSNETGAQRMAIRTDSNNCFKYL